MEYFSADLQAPLMTAALPLRASDGRVVAVLAARMNLDAFNTIVLRRTGLRQTEDALIVNAQRFPITQPRVLHEPVVLSRQFDTEAVRLCAARNSGVTFAPDYRGVTCIAVYRWNAKHQFGLISKIDQSEALAPARAFGESLLWIGGLALLLASAVALRLARSITAPLHALRASVGCFAEGKFDTRVAVFAGDELGDVGRAFNQMAAQIAADRESLCGLQQFQEAILNGISHGIHGLNLAGNITFENPAAERMLGWEANELLGRPAHATMHHHRPDGSFFPFEQCPIYATLRDGKFREVAAEMFWRKDGTSFPVRYNVAPLRAAAGEITGAVVIFADITERKMIDEQLRDTQAELAHIFEQSPAITYRHRIDGERIIPQTASGNFARLLGFTTEEAMNMEWWLEHLHPDDRERAVASISDLMNLGANRIEYRIRHKDGRYFWMEDSRQLIRDAGGQAVEIVGVWIDVTARKQSERALEQIRERLLLATASAHIGVWDLDLMSNKLVWDAQMFALYGIREQDVGGAYDAWQKGLHPDDRERGDAAIAAAISGIRDFNIEFRVVWPNGEVRYVEAHGIVQRGGNGAAIRIIGVNWDITETKQSEAALQKAHREMVDLSRQAGMAEVATTVLHNVGNVLNSVNVSVTLASDRIKRIGIDDLSRAAGLLREKAGDLPGFFANDPRGAHLPTFLESLSDRFGSEQKALLVEMDSLTANVDHIKEIVAMQQNYARVSGVVEVLPPSELVEESLRLDAGSFERHGVEVVRDFADVPPILVEKHKVIQILVNLIRNADHACDEGGRAEKRVCLRIARNGGDCINISVADNGVGIPAENLTRIFEHGFTTRHDGHGWGLHSAAITANELGGSLRVKSDGHLHPDAGASDAGYVRPCW